MLNTRLFCRIALLVALVSACGPAQLQPSGPQPLPSPSASWSLSLSQSGGIAGVSLKLDISSDGQLTAADQRSGRSVSQSLPPETMAKLTALYAVLALVTAQSPASTCADCFIYDLEVTSSGRVVSVHADDTTLNASGAGDIIRYLRQLRDTALKSQP